MTSTKSRKSPKPTKARKNAKALKTKPAVALFGGKVEATAVYKRPMKEFKNCQAFCWLLVNKIAGTHTTVNSFNGDTPKYSFDPATYTYPTKNPQAIERKIAQDGFEELDVTEWPEWITNAHAGKRRRK